MLCKNSKMINSVLIMRLQHESNSFRPQLQLQCLLQRVGQSRHCLQAAKTICGYYALKLFLKMYFCITILGLCVCFFFNCPLGGSTLQVNKLKCRMIPLFTNKCGIKINVLVKYTKCLYEINRFYLEQ